MVHLVGGLTIVVEADQDVSYTEVEDALKVEGFLSDYMINRSATPGRTQLTISVSRSSVRDHRGRRPNP
jgi:hypothetical protein